MKKIYFLIVFLFMIISSHAQISMNGLIAWYPFCGNAIDHSGNGFNGIVTGATLTADRFGNANNAYAFNGTSNYITVPLTNSINTSSFSGISISLWVNFNTLSGIDEGVIDFASASDFGIDFDWDGQASNKIWCYDSTTNISNTGVLKINTWYNLVCVSDYNANQLNFYLNGVLQNQISFTNSHLIANQINIGRHISNVWGSGWYMNGAIDDIRIYNRPITNNEIQSIYTDQPFYDTIRVVINDTIKVPVNDTIKITKTINDTIFTTVEDTLKINVTLTALKPPLNVSVISVYPNPTKSILYINTGNYQNMNNYQLKIINIKGNVLWQSSITQQLYSIDMNTFGTDGLYLLQILNADSNVIDVRKILLQ